MKPSALVILPSPQAEQWHGDGATGFGSLGPRTEEAAWLDSGQLDGREGEGGWGVLWQREAFHLLECLVGIRRSQSLQTEGEARPSLPASRTAVFGLLFSLRAGGGG